MIGEAVKGAFDSFFGTAKEIIKEFHISPEALARLEMEKDKQASEIAVRLEDIAAKDRDSARNREIQVKDPTTRNIAYISLGGFFAVLGAEFYFAFSNHVIAAPIQRTLDITLGVLFAMVLAVKDYYFGTSSGSDSKTGILDRLVNHRG